VNIVVIHVNNKKRDKCLASTMARGHHAMDTGKETKQVPVMALCNTVGPETESFRCQRGREDRWLVGSLEKKERRKEMKESESSGAKAKQGIGATQVHCAELV
jgi:hypothetical protein